MPYAIVFGLLAGYLAFLAVVLGAWGWLLLWPAVSSALLAAAYAGLGPRIFGKRSDGRLSGPAIAVLLPVLLLLWGLWHLSRLVSRERCCNENAPGVWLGRRAFVRELPPGVVLVVDLTAEFPAPWGMREGRAYLTLPTLDCGVPDERAFREALERVNAASGAVYIHCAQGHGRSAVLAAAVLLERHLASDVRQAEAQLRRARPGVRLRPAQRRLLDRLFPQRPGEVPQARSASEETSPR
jgi:protein-tyrosine phosphatase